MTTESSTIANCSWTCAAVHAAKSWSPAVAIRAQRRRLELVAGEQDADGRDRARTAARGHAGQVERLALTHCRPDGDRDEVEAAGLANELTDGRSVGDARQLDDDAIRAARDDDRLGHAGRVHPGLDDLADDLEVGKA